MIYLLLQSTLHARRVGHSAVHGPDVPFAVVVVDMASVSSMHCPGSPTLIGESAPILRPELRLGDMGV